MFSRNKRIIIAIIFTLSPVFFILANEADSTKWIRVPSPINSDIKYISFSSSRTGIASGKQIILYNNNEWLKYSPQPPASIDLLFPVDTNSFYITSQTKRFLGEQLCHESIQRKPIHHQS